MKRRSRFGAREDLMDSFFVRSWWVPALRGLAGILFGVLALAWPGMTLVTLILLFAAYALVAGFASVAGAIRHRRTEDEWWIAMLLGLVSIGAGVVAVLNPAVTALVLVLVMGANALVSGVLDIFAAIRLRKMVEGEWLMVLSGLASVAFGAIVFLYPGAGALALVWLVSLYAIVSGAALLALSVRMRAHGAARKPGEERRILPDRRMAPAR
jgi:uncharacterized membrane protein HdeD (DUF308 family)